MTSVDVGIHVLHRTSCLELAISIFAVIMLQLQFLVTKNIRIFFFSEFLIPERSKPLRQRGKKKKSRESGPIPKFSRLQATPLLRGRHEPQGQLGSPCSVVCKEGGGRGRKGSALGLTVVQ